jgi:hypothetical protein
MMIPSSRGRTRMTTYGAGNYRVEYPNFDPMTLPSIPATWIDESWASMSCPMFRAPGGKCVYVDYLDPDLREFPDSKRFSVHDDELDDVTLETDDWGEVLRHLG